MSGAGAARYSRPWWRARIAYRLFASFAVLLLLFVAALAVCLHSFASIAGAEREVEAYERARHAADRASIRMRDLYSHQAHTLILFDGSHLEHYREVAVAARAATDDLRSALASAEDMAIAEELLAIVSESDRVFEQRTVPAVLAGRRDEARRLHETTEGSVIAYSTAVAELHRRNDARASAARAAADQAWSRARAASLACLGFAVATAALLGFFITKSVMVRIEALRAGTRRLGEGDLGAKITLDGDDELSELANAFNAMAAALRERQAELIRTQKLAAMGQMAAGVAHELNNPLGVILGYVKLVRRSGELDPEALRIIEDEATNASVIVQSLLDLSRPYALRFSDVDLAILARESVERLRVLSRFDTVDCNEPDANESVLVRADEARLREVIVNLLTNAAEAAGPAGRVAIHVEPGANIVRLKVDDSGEGIAEADCGKVTDAFFTTKPTGVGLGLSIVHAIVESHRGSMRFERSPLGGARVVVELPRPVKDAGAE